MSGFTMVWLHDAVETNMPYDKMVNAMLSAKGHTAKNPAVGYYLRDRGMLLDNVSNTVQVFLGQQIGCAQCHDHPFDTFTQMEYYELASFLEASDYRFNGGREKIIDLLGVDPGKRKTMMSDKPLTKKERRELRQARRANGKLARDFASIFRYHNRNALTENHRRKLRLPDDYKYEDADPGDTVEPATLFGEKLGDVPPGKRREAFASWVTSPENPYFTKVIANRLWDYVYGYGLVPALDDWSNAPDPVYPELITTIEKAMKLTNYDVKEFLRILYHTQLFQRTASAEEPQPGFLYDFAGPILRRLDAEEIRDSFITLNSGVIDGNSNGSLKRSWTEYTNSFNYVMSAPIDEIREINEAIDEAEKRRKALGGKVSKLRTSARKAREAGDHEKARELFTQIRKLRKNNYKGAMQAEPDSPAAKARAASMRRNPRRKPEHSVFKLRSSELPAPAKGGSLVRQFGGSDRETPSSSHTKATIPQTLRLLNGKEANFLIGRKTKFARSIQKLKTPEERLDYLFLSLYSAYPTEKEKEAFLSETGDAKSAAVLARAMITSNRFLFVQ